MCGIAGVFVPGKVADVAMIRAMCDQIRHRGPDDEGYHMDGSCAIGMRRLSIIDLSAGHQPMSNEDETVWVVFNGEIYNYQELRQNLIAQGHSFRTKSDTETLVHLYEQEGEAGLAKLRGMFAFAIWDARRRRLLLARDRFGKKPLYYAVLSEGIYFASELKCLRVTDVPLEVDQQALRLYFQFSYIPDPASPFQAVRKLPAGSWLSYDDNGKMGQGRYWRLPIPQEQEPTGISEEEMCQQLRETFDESVRIRMIADVPLGAFLSGGIDSSCVVASMALQSREPVKTFSIGFEERGFNELEYARLVAGRYQTEHHEIVVRPDSAALIARLARDFDEPFGDSSAIPTYVVSEFAARHVKVALSGDGGDELFGGYTRFADADRLRVFDRVPQSLRRAISWIAARLPYSSYGRNYLRMMSRPDALDRYFERNFAPFFMRERLLEREWMLPSDVDLHAVFADCLLPEGTDIVSQVMYWETAANLTGDILVKVDRMSMANSLEVRCPLLDHCLAGLAAEIPNGWKIRQGRGKDILIRAMAGRLPPELLSRPKQGFAVPLADWFRSSLRELLRDHLTSSRFLQRGVVSAAFVSELIQEHERGRRDNSSWLWALLMLDMWFQEFESDAPHPPRVARAVPAG